MSSSPLSVNCYRVLTPSRCPADWRLWLWPQVSTSWELWSLFGDLTAAGGSPSEEDRFRRVQRYQKAHSCITQKPGAEKPTDTARQMLQIAVKVCKEYSYIRLVIGNAISL